MRVLAVSDSESFLKWSVSTLEQIAADDPTAVCRSVTIKGPLEPSAAQVDAAMVGTTVRSSPVVSRRQLARLVREHRPDAVLVAATGPIAEMIALTVLRAGRARPPVLICGPPGVAMSAASTRGVKWRYRWCDAYIVHSPRELEVHRRELERYAAHPRMILARLPFLAAPRTSEPTPDQQATRTPVDRIVFAPQAVVPYGRADRLRILRRLAELAQSGFDVVVKVRTRAGEQQTHHEAVPFQALWRHEHSRLGFDENVLRFEHGAISQWLTAGTALVTVSSTAALEALALGRPTGIIADFGVSDALGNEVYADSGCLVTLAELDTVLRRGGPVPRREWMEANYFHSGPRGLGRVLRELVASGSRRAAQAGARPAPVSRPLYVYSQLKSDMPWLWRPAKWTRAVIGRFRQLY